MVRVVKTRVEVEGRVHEETVVVEREEPGAWEDGRSFNVVGQPINRIDAVERVTGAAKYTYDVKPAGLLAAAVLRCPHPHARIVRLDVSRAEQLPGVRGILSSLNAPAIPWYAGASRLFDTELRFAGEEVAAIAADDMDTALDALKLIEVEYEVLPFVTDTEEALKPGAPRVHPQGNDLKGDSYQRGDAASAMKSAAVVVEGRFTTPTALHNSFETHGSVAMWDGDELTIWESTQYLYGVRGRVSQALDMPLSRVRVISEYIGGGFGSKGGTFKQPVIAALLAKQTGRPVKLMLDRRAENLLAGNRGATIQKLRIGAAADGTLLAIELDAYNNIGAYGGWAAEVGGPAKELYLCPNVRIDTSGVRTNLGTHAAFRAPGFTEGTFALESLVDVLCAKLSMDPIEFRRKNYATLDQVSGQEYTGKHLDRCYSEAARLAGYVDAALPSEGTLPASGPWRRGAGIASQIWSSGGGPPAHAVVRFNGDGTVEVMAGTQDIGTGTKTALCQIVSEELGVPVDQIRFRIGDTQKGPYAPASWGSITVPSMGPAVRSAAEDARRQLLDISSYFMEVPASELTVIDGSVAVQGREEGRRTIADILAEIGDYMIMGKGFRGPNPTEPLRTWGAQVAEVAVNVETGEVQVERIAAVHDVGRVINPQGLASQFYGGILQGVGFGLFEQRRVDSRTGTVLNDNLQDYKVPTLADTPEMLVSAIDIPDTAANHVGSKGAGEPPIIPTAAAIANAIHNATGVRVTDLPVSRAFMLRELARTQEVTVDD